MPRPGGEGLRPDRLDSGRRGGCLQPRQRHALAAGLDDRPRVQRTALANRLRAVRDCPLVTLVAPAGYGKTTLLSQWAERDPRCFAWVDAGPGRRTVRAARESVTSVLREARRRPDPRRHGDARPRHRRLGGCRKTDRARLRRRPPPQRRDGGPRFAVDRSNPGGIARWCSPAARSRSSPALRSRCCAPPADCTRSVPRDLALSRREAGAALKATGVSMTDAELTALLEETEGWPAGIRRGRRGALERRRRPPELPRGSRRAPRVRPRGVSGSARAGTAGIPAADVHSRPDVRRALRRDARLEQARRRCSTRSPRSASSSSRSTVAARWFRYHHLLRDSLRQSSSRRSRSWSRSFIATPPAGSNVTVTRAARCAMPTRPEPRKTSPRIFGAAALAEYGRGRSAAVQEWLADLGDEELATDRQAAVVAARLHAHSGRLAEAERCLAVAARGRGHDARTGAAVALVRAALCHRGVETMLTDADRALEKLPGDDLWRPYGLLLAGTARALLGDDGAATILGRAVVAAERLEAHDSKLLALAESSLLAANQGSWAAADAHLLRACGAAEEHGLEGHPGFALALALCARLDLRNGRWTRGAGGDREGAAPPARLTCALPWLAVQARLELAAAFVMLRDADSAGTCSSSDELLRTRRARIPSAQRDRLAGEVGAIPAGGEGQTSRSTGAELRLPAAPRDPPVLPGDRRAPVPLPAHRQDPGDLGVSQARSVEPQGSGRRAARLGLIEAPTDLAA